MGLAKTPAGTVTWEGTLTPESTVTFDDGSSAPIQRWIALTNGEALEWLEEYL